MTDTIAPLLVKWLCHDLASPIATVMTASELLGEPADPEINALVSDAAARLAARLRLVRAALAPGTGPMGAPALRKLIADGIGAGVEWQRGATDSDGNETAMIAALALLLADCGRNRGLTVAADHVAWTGVGLPLADSIAAALGGGAVTDGRSALAAMALAAATAAGRHLDIDIDRIGWTAAPHREA